jgi:hypothetical protein
MTSKLAYKYYFVFLRVLTETVVRQLFHFLLCLGRCPSTHVTKAFRSSRSSTSLTRAAKSSSPLVSAWFLKYSMLSFSQLPSSPAYIATLCVSMISRGEPQTWMNIHTPGIVTPFSLAATIGWNTTNSNFLASLAAEVWSSSPLRFPLSFPSVICAHGSAFPLFCISHAGQTFSPLTTFHHSSSSFSARASKSAFVRLSLVRTMARMRFVALVRAAPAMK